MFEVNKSYHKTMNKALSSRYFQAVPALNLPAIVFFYYSNLREIRVTDINKVTTTTFLVTSTEGLTIDLIDHVTRIGNGIM